MARIRRYMNFVNGWEQVATASEGLPYLEASRLKLRELIAQARSQSADQAAYTAIKQQITKDLRQTLRSGQLLVDLLKTAAKEHFGPDSEKLVEFGVQPFRGKVRTAPSPGGVEDAEPTAPAPLTPSHTPDPRK